MLLTAMMRRHELTAMESALSWQLLTITSALRVATEEINDLGQVGNDYEAGSKMEKRLEYRQAKFKNIERKLKAQKEQIEAELNEVKTEKNSLKEIIANEIREMFTYNTAGGR